MGMFVTDYVQVTKGVIELSNKQRRKLSSKRNSIYSRIMSIVYSVLGMLCLLKTMF